MFEYPERGKFKFPLIIKGKTYNIKYLQATAEETIDYHKISLQDSEKIKKYRLDFIKKHIELTIYQKINFIKLKKIFTTVESQIFDITQDISKTCHKLWTSVYTGLPQAKQKGVSKVVFDNSYSVITDATMIPSNEINKRLTFEQVMWWLDKVRFDYYSTFDEGKRVNEMIKDEKEVSKYKNISEMIDREFKK